MENPRLWIRPRLGAALLLFCAIHGGLFAEDNAMLSGRFAFAGNANQLDSAGATGGAVIGILDFDGAGIVTGTYTIKTRTGRPNTDAGTGSGAVTGTYTINADGTGVANLDFDL